jgi:hypothetical protein
MDSLVSSHGLRLEYSLLHQFCSKRNEIRLIDGQHLNRCAGATSSPVQDHAIPGKMALPLLFPGMKERHYLTAQSVNAGNVGAFMLIAM